MLPNAKNKGRANTVLSNCLNVSLPPKKALRGCKELTATSTSILSVACSVMVYFTELSSAMAKYQQLLLGVKIGRKQCEEAGLTWDNGVLVSMVCVTGQTSRGAL